MPVRVFRDISLVVLFAGAAWLASASAALAQPKAAEPATREANAEVLRSLPFGDRADFEDAQRGFIAPLPGVIMSADRQRTIWSMKPYAFETGEAPATVNPSLWRQAQLNNFHGLFKVTERVYQIRGLDDSNMTIVESDSGLIVIDTLSAVESAKASMDLYYENRARKPVVAVIYSHTHVDHFGGVKGVVSEVDVRAGKVKIFAPIISWTMRWPTTSWPAMPCFGVPCISSARCCRLANEARSMPVTARMSHAPVHSR